jgi:hypothetical protein
VIIAIGLAVGVGGGLVLVLLAAAVHHVRRMADAAVRLAQAAEVHVVIARRNLEASERMAATIAAPRTVATPVTTMNGPGRVQ